MPRRRTFVPPSRNRTAGFRVSAGVELADVMVLVAVATALLVPLGWEYASFRRELRLGRAGALLMLLLLLPAFAVGLAVALPLAASPGLQWSATVLVTLAAYSLATSALGGAIASRAPGRSG